MKVGKQTFLTPNVFLPYSDSLAGPMEGKGSFGSFYDMTLENDGWNCKTYEKTEIKMHKQVIDNLLEKSEMEEADIDLLLGGDLLNQIITTTFSAREFEIPFLGLYSACSTFGAGLGLGAIMVSSGFCNNIICCTSSHFSTAERQYRYPLELGTQATPTSQWTVTGAGGNIISSKGNNCPKITSVTLGKIVDMGINNVNDMGGAMAPAACDTIVAHFEDTGLVPEYYDLIVTGDLGRHGRDALHYLCKNEGLYLDNLNDCGAMIYTDKQKKAIQGGSGAGCSSLVFNGYFYKEMLEGKIKKILLVPTGALLSKLSSLQGESIPAIAHAIAIEM